MQRAAPQWHRGIWHLARLIKSYEKCARRPSRAPTLLIQSEDGGFSYGSIYYYLALKAAGATSDNPHSGHQHELHQYPDRPETAKHGYGRCTHPHVESDVCQWPGNAQRFMQALGVAK